MQIANPQSAWPTPAQSVIAIKTQRRQDSAGTEKTSAEAMNNAGRRDNKDRRWFRRPAFQAKFTKLI